MPERDNLLQRLRWACFLTMKKPSVGAGASWHAPACERSSECAKPVRKRIVCAFAQVLRNRCCGSMPERANLLQRLRWACFLTMKKLCRRRVVASCHAPACESKRDCAKPVRKRIVCAFAQVLRNRCCGFMPERDDLLQRLHSLACPNHEEALCRRWRKLPRSGMRRSATAQNHVEKAHSMRFRTGFAKSLLRLHAGALQLATTLRLHSFFLTMKQALCRRGRKLSRSGMRRSATAQNLSRKRIVCAFTTGNALLRCGACRSVTTCYNAYAGLAS